MKDLRVLLWDIDGTLVRSARAVGVGTGRVNSVETLRPHNPDVLLPDLSDTEAVMRAFDSL
jgi:phosphoglycolate phosphatase-like HAD superfamily hydrolase